MVLDIKYCSGIAKRWQVDPARVLAWHVFSNFYLEGGAPPEEKEEMAETLAVSPFSIAELAHIAYYEVNPVCVTNLICWWEGGEWASFDLDWLIPKCKKLMTEKPFKPSDRDAELPHFKWQQFVFTYYGSLSLIKQVALLRKVVARMKCEGM